MGDGVPVFGISEEQLTVLHSYAPAHLNKQRAGAVANAWHAVLQRGKMESAEETAGIFRLSRAERDARSREAAKGKENV